MAFNGTEGSSIDPNLAASWTRNFREQNPGAIESNFLGRDIIQKILNQEGNKGIRFYYALDGGVPRLVAVGANGQEDDQLNASNIVADDMPQGPPRRGQPDILNS